jgi:hypothetical protein
MEIKKIIDVQKKEATNGKKYWLVKFEDETIATAWTDLKLEAGKEYDVNLKTQNNYTNIISAEDLSKNQKLEFSEEKITPAGSIMAEVLQKRLDTAITIVCELWDTDIEEIKTKCPELISQITGVFIGLGK